MMAANPAADSSTRLAEVNVDVEGQTEPPPPYHTEGGAGGPGYGTTENAPPSYDDAGDPTAPPPSYESLYGRVKAAKQESSGVAQFLQKVAGLVIGTLGCTICLGLFLAIPIAMIVMGSLNLNKCNAERYIPIYLIVGGVFGLLKNMSSFGHQVKNKKNNDEDGNTKTNPFDGILNCFLLAWFIAGNYWIYHIHNDYQWTDIKQPMYCDRTFYLFAFWQLTVTYIFIGLVCFCICCAGCFAGAVSSAG